MDCTVSTCAGSRVLILLSHGTVYKGMDAENSVFKKDFYSHSTSCNLRYSSSTIKGSRQQRYSKKGVAQWPKEQGIPSYLFAWEIPAVQ